MAYGSLYRQPAIAAHSGERRLKMAYDWDGTGTYGDYEGLGGFNPFKAIANVVKGAVKGVTTVAKKVVAPAIRTVLPMVPVVGTAAAGVFDYLTQRSAGSPDSSYQTAYPGTAWPMTAPINPSGQGVNILEALKQEMLRQGGQWIARTPEGQAAIRAELATQARQKAVTTGKSMLPWLAAGIPLLLIATSKRR